MLRTNLSIARSGVTAVLLHPLRSATAVACIVAVLLPYVSGVAIARGAREQAIAAIDAGPELHVSRIRFGRAAPLPRSVADEMRAVPGVREVVPRIVGELALGIEVVPVVVIGMPADRVPGHFGLQPSAGTGPQFVVGAELARRLHIQEGSYLPPFYHSGRGDRVSRIAGVLDDTAPASSAHVMYTTLSTAAEIFGERDSVTDLLITCQPGVRDAVREKIEQQFADYRVTSRDELRAQLPESLRHLDGVFQIHFVLAFALGIPLLLVASGVGLLERRREASLLKATGWMTDQLLLRAFIESLVLSVTATAIAIIGGWIWLAWGNGAGLAGIFLPGWAWGSAMQVPYRLGVEATLVAGVLSFSIVAVGSCYSTWRVATAPVRLVLR